MTPRWTPALPLAELPPGEVRVFRHERAQVAIFRLADGQVRACDNRCPHEGYPLAQGTVQGSIVTCWYHNYKFDLTDGACVLGEERLSVVPVRIDGDQVWLDLAPPDPAAEIERRRASLEGAVQERRIGQIAREVVRLLALGVPATDLATAAAAWDATHGEYGGTHALPVAAEALRLVSEFALEGVAQARVLVLPFELASDASARRAPHAWPAPAPVGADLVEPLRAAVAAEDPEAAVAVVRGAIGRPLPEIGAALYRVASDHLFEYGHGLIYVDKAMALLEGSGTERAEPILCGLARQLATGTRDDLVPTWAPYRRAVAEIGADDLAAWARQQAPLPDREAAVQALVAASPRESVAAVLALLRGGAAPLAVADALALAAAERCLRFDVAHDADPTLQDAWLDVTHLLTFAAATRSALRRCDHPDLVRLLPQVARLVARMRPLDRADGRASGVDAGVDALLAAVAARDPDRAAAAALGLDPRAPDLRRRLCGAALQTEMVLPIFVAHAIKLTLAGLDEAEALGDARPIAAAARFIASRPVERRTEQRVAEAIALVADGRAPRTLAV